MEAAIEMRTREMKLGSKCLLLVCHRLLGSIFLKLFSAETVAQLVRVGDGWFEQGVVPYNLLHLMDIPIS